MSVLDRIDRTSPRLAFVRRIPPQRIAMRLLRRVQKAAGIMARTGPVDAVLRSPALLPAPPFKPRPISASKEPGGWRFAFLGHERTFPGTIDWNGRDPAFGQLWRMNLHYMEFLEVLPFGPARDAILSWIAGNPAEGKDAQFAGWNGYALSLRVVCWLQWLQREGTALSGSELAAIGESIASQVAWLARFPETDLGGNHLIKNIKALIWAAACFDGDAPQGWKRRALRLLHSELARQVLEDGMHFERSVSYHNQVTADLIECAAALPEPEGAFLCPVIAKMISVSAALSHPDGRVAQFNDAGLSMAYDADALIKAASVTPEVRESSIMRNGGFASLRSDLLSTFVKFGEIGADTLPAHAHGDIGTVELSCGRHRLIVDQGVFEYVEGDRRTASRSAFRHNITAPEGSDMADFFGAFRCGWRPQPTVEFAGATPELLSISVSHDGFHDEQGRCNPVRRVLRAAADQVEIEDSLALPAITGWKSRFLIHPDWSCDCDGNSVVLRRGEQIVRCEGSVATECEDAVWWPDMGFERKTRRIVFGWPKGCQKVTFRFAAIREQ